MTQRTFSLLLMSILAFLALGGIYHPRAFAQGNSNACGNGVCQENKGETCAICPIDCGICPTPDPTPTATPTPTPTDTPTPTSTPTPTTVETPTPTPTSIPTDTPTPTSTPTPTTTSPPPSEEEREEQVVPVKLPTIPKAILKATPLPAPPGSPGTTVLSTHIGETTVQTPVLPDEDDRVAPIITFTNNPDAKENIIRFTGTATDQGGVIVGISYSLDNGLSWHPVSSATGIGKSRLAFSVSTPTLPDGTYHIQVRARDNSENESTTSPIDTTVDLLPVMFGGIVMTSATGNQLSTTTPVAMIGESFTFTASFMGGVTSATLRAGNETLPLTPSPNKLRWRTTIPMKEKGATPLILSAQDGNGHRFEQQVGEITITSPLRLIDTATNSPISHASILLESLDPHTQIWRQDRIHSTHNPIGTDHDGYVPIRLSSPGTYRLYLSAHGYWGTYTEPIEISAAGALLNGTMAMMPRPWYTRLLPLQTHPTNLSLRQHLILPERSRTTLKDPPKFSFTDLAGNTHSLDEYRGKTVLVSLLGLWNSTSRDQLTTLDEISTLPGIAVIPIDIQHIPSAFAGILARGHYTVSGFVDTTGSDTADLEHSMLPTHYIFTPEGVLRSVHMGYITREEFKIMVQ